VKTLTQLGGLLRYEARLYARRRGLLVLLLAALVVPVGMALQTAWPVVQQQATANPVELGRVAVYMTWAPVFVAQMLLLPVLVADGVPRDEQWGVRELLDSLPLTPGTYLAGKLLGLWACLAGGVLLGLALTGLAWRLAGPFDLRPFVDMWLVGVGGVVVLNGTLGLLLGAGQTNRWRAVLLGAALVAAMVFTLGPGLFAEPGSAQEIWNPARPALLNYHNAGWLLAPDQRTAYWQTLALGAGQAAVLGAVVWAWLRRRSA